MIPGINVQWPWSQFIANGTKVIETRSYDIPEKYRGIELALIETPGPNGKKRFGIESARIIGIVIFEETFQYKSMATWNLDRRKHLVQADDPVFSFQLKKPKWAWKIKSYIPLKTPVEAPKKRGIVFALECRI